MKPAVHLFLNSFFCAVALVTVFSGGISHAHVSADSMPDSVAETEYRIFLEFRPNDIVVLNKLGMVYYRLNKLSDAVREFSKVLKMDPDNYDALDGLGMVKAAQQEYDEAIKYYQQAIGINKDDMVGYYHLAMALEEKGMISEAAEKYRTSLAKHEKLYPPGTDNKKAAEFAETIRAAIRNIETKL